MVAKRKSDESDKPLLSVHPTDGDFAHARRRSVKLACGCSTTCCLTLILGAGGGVAGLITGMVRVSRGPREERAGARRVGMTVLRFLLYALIYCIAGLLIGAAVGFGIDYLFFLG